MEKCPWDWPDALALPGIPKIIPSLLSFVMWDSNAALSLIQKRSALVTFFRGITWIKKNLIQIQSFCDIWFSFQASDSYLLEIRDKMDWYIPLAMIMTRYYTTMKAKSQKKNWTIWTKLISRDVGLIMSLACHMETVENWRWTCDGQLLERDHDIWESVCSSVTGNNSPKYVNKLITKFFMRHLCILLSSLSLSSGMDMFFTMAHSGRRTPCGRGRLCWQWSRNETLRGESSVKYDYRKFLEGSLCGKEIRKNASTLLSISFEIFWIIFLNLKSEIEDVQYLHLRSNWIEMVVEREMGLFFSLGFSKPFESHA